MVASLTGLALAAASPAQAAGGFDPTADRGARVLKEAGASVGLGVLGLGAGLLVAVAASSGSGHSREGGFGLAVAFVGAAIVGATLAESAGVYAAGAGSGANGSYWGTIAGQGVGLGAALGISLGVAETRASDSNKTLVWVTTLVVLPLVGAIVGYEATTQAEPATGTASSAVRGGAVRPAQLAQWSMAF